MKRRCPECACKEDRHAFGCSLAMPVSSDPSPKTPPPSAPSFVHSLASLEERLTRRIATLEAILKGYGPPPPAPPQEDAQMVDVRCPDCGRKRSDALMGTVVAGRTLDGGDEITYALPHVPEGVVPPHVRANLEAIEQWTRPDLWTLTGQPEEQVRTRAMLDKFHGLVMLALAGEDVPRPS